MRLVQKINRESIEERRNLAGRVKREDEVRTALVHQSRARDEAVRLHNEVRAVTIGLLQRETDAEPAKEEKRNRKKTHRELE